MTMIALHRPPAVSFERSVVAAIDEPLARFSGRDLELAAEVVDMLLGLRLLPEADEIVAPRR